MVIIYKLHKKKTVNIVSLWGFTILWFSSEIFIPKIPPFPNADYFKMIRMKGYLRTIKLFLTQRKKERKVFVFVERRNIKQILNWFRHYVFWMKIETEGLEAIHFSVSKTMLWEYTFRPKIPSGLEALVVFHPKLWNKLFLCRLSQKQISSFHFYGLLTTWMWNFIIFKDLLWNFTFVLLLIVASFFASCFVSYLFVGLQMKRRRTANIFNKEPLNYSS